MMRHCRSDLEALLGGQKVFSAGNRNGKCSSEDKKELPAPLVVVRNFGCLRRHGFLNDADVRIPQKMPAIAPIAPDIVFS